jgi:plastocyanin
VYQWWVFLHLAGVFAFLIAHGASMMVAFRLRTERDPRRVNELLQLSGSTTQGMYISLAVLVVAGAVAGFVGHLWSHLWSSVWIWAAIAVLVLTTGAMLGMARPYYRRVRTVAAAKAEGETSVSDEQFDEVLRSGRSNSILAIGVVGLAVILYFMLFKPTFGLSSTSVAPQGAVQISAHNIAFATKSLAAPAGKAFTLAFDNADPGVPHNVSIYTDSSAAQALFKGTVVTGPKTIDYQVKALPAGSYFFRCDVHPTLMTGTLVVK